MKHIFGISIIVVPFLILLIWAMLHNKRKDQERLSLLDGIARHFGSPKESSRFDLDVQAEGVVCQVGIGQGGESDPDMLYVSRPFEPMPDGIIFIFQRGINRWVSRKLATGDARFDRTVSFQVNAFQKQPDRYLLAEKLCRDPIFRKALLNIADAGYSHLWIPGALSQGSRLDKITKSLMGVTGMLMAYVTNPKPKHYEAHRIEMILPALALIAESVDARRMLA